MASDLVAGVDVGGTFTDVVIAGAGVPRALKVPTTAPDQAVGVATGVAAGAGTGVGRLAHGTTTATNAILERAGARTVLVTTDGFADVLAIARQDRPSLYDLRAVRPEPLVPPSLVVTVRERTAPDGTAVVALTETECRRVVAQVAARRPQAVAVSLLFSWASPAHEERLCAALADALDVPVTRSSRLLPEFREYERASTCVLNAAVSPVMQRYLTGLSRRMPGTSISVMTSGGGSAGVDAVADAPVHTLLSGPAAGVVAAAACAARAGFGDAVAFDMGGTSTDVCLIRGGEPEVTAEGTIGGLPFRTPAVAIHTVGAGGGSIAEIDTGGALRVGPRSAGAVPGPACYGRGGQEPTVTDAHCALGHLDPHGALSGLHLDAEAARAALSRLPSAAGGAQGVLAVVRAAMVRALRRVTTERGVDPSELALVAYGGAGPLHASALARMLGSRVVIIPAAPGVFSALGLLLAPPRHEAARTVMAAPGAELEPRWRALADAAVAELRRQGVAGEVAVQRVADCRYAGQGHELRVALPPGADVVATLAAAHEQAYGYALPGHPVEIVTLRAVAEGRAVLPVPPASWDLGTAGAARSRAVHDDGRATQVPVCDRAALHRGERLRGPAIVEQPDSTTLLGAGDDATVDEAGNLIVRVRT